MAKTFTPQELGIAAAYFAKKKWPARSAAAASTPPPPGIAVCQVCHAAELPWCQAADGMAAPRLAGQSYEYLVEAMRRFAEGERKNNADHDENDGGDVARRAGRDGALHVRPLIGSSVIADGPGDVVDVFDARRVDTLTILLNTTRLREDISGQGKAQIGNSGSREAIMDSNRSGRRRFLKQAALHWRVWPQARNGPREASQPSRQA